jgi:hypothetical protein
MSLCAFCRWRPRGRFLDNDAEINPCSNDATGRWTTEDNVVRSEQSRVFVRIPDVKAANPASLPAPHSKPFTNPFAALSAGRANFLRAVLKPRIVANPTSCASRAGTLSDSRRPATNAKAIHRVRHHGSSSVRVRACALAAAVMISQRR